MSHQTDCNLLGCVQGRIQALEWGSLNVEKENDRLQAHCQVESVTHAKDCESIKLTKAEHCIKVMLSQQYIQM